MSAEPQRKAYRYTCSMIRPQMYSEKSLMESVVDFFSDVVPQAYSGTQKVEDKEKIQWVRFENCDCNDIAKNPDMYRSDTKGLPLLLILGYSNGVQIWHITPNGESQEIMSVRQGPVRILRILPNPDSVYGYSDTYSSKRPLAIMCDSSSAGQPYCGVKFVSLKTGDEVHSISFKTLPIHNIECNKRFVVIVFLEKICVYESCQFKQLFWTTSCFPCPGLNVNPVALSTRWLAYADKRLVAMHQSCGGMSGDGSQSYAATVISAAKGAFKGLSMFGEAMVNSVTGCKAPTGKKDYVQLDNGNRPGIISVVDIQNVHNDHFNVNEDNEGDGLLAHFHAHANEPVSNMAFDPTGTLLVTACKLGHNFHVFRLMAHPCGSSLGAVHHLYTLHRGDTTAKVIDISFNHDSRWVTVSTHRGTTHLFPITTYGGPVTVRTHCHPNVVNRASRFHKSAGLQDIEHSPMGRRSPILSTSPGSSGQYDRYPTLIQQNTLNNNMGNPRLPPYPHPITVFPAFQVKQPLNVVLNPANKNQSPNHSATGFDNVYSVCARFCTPRLCVIGSPKLDVERREGGKRPVESLFVMAQSGTLVEYVLEPKAKAVNEKVTDDTNLDLAVSGRMQWNLQRLKNSPELRPPLPSNSPLILAYEAVVSQIPTASDLYDFPGLTRQDSKDSLSSDHSSKDDMDEQWLSQVEIITHVGPHRRLWMGPQFSFKTYQENTTVLSSNSSALLSQSPETNMAAMDITGDEGDLESVKVQPARSNPVTMPMARPAYRRLSGSDSSPSTGLGGATAPLMIEAGSFEQSPHLLDVYSNWTESTVEKRPRGSDDMEEDRIKETLADAMVESPIKDIEKLSLRQECSRTSVTSGKAKNRSEKRESMKDRREGVEKKEISVEATSGGNKKRSNVDIDKGIKGHGKNVSKVVRESIPEKVNKINAHKIEIVDICKDPAKNSKVTVTETADKNSVKANSNTSDVKQTGKRLDKDSKTNKELKVGLKNDNQTAAKVTEESNRGKGINREDLRQSCEYDKSAKSEKSSASTDSKVKLKGSSSQKDTSKLGANSSDKAKQNVKQNAHVGKCESIKKEPAIGIKPTIDTKRNDEVEKRSSLKQVIPRSENKKDEKVKGNNTSEKTRVIVKQNINIENGNLNICEISTEVKQNDDIDLNNFKEGEETVSVNHAERVDISSQKNIESATDVHDADKSNSGSSKEVEPLVKNVQHNEVEVCNVDETYVEEQDEAMSIANDFMNKVTIKEPDVSFKAENKSVPSSKSLSGESMTKSEYNVDVTKKNGKQKKNKKKNGKIETELKKTDNNVERSVAEAKSDEKFTENRKPTIDTVDITTDIGNQTKADRLLSPLGKEETELFERTMDMPDSSAEKNAVLLETKSPKRRRKKKNEMEDSVYFEAIELPNTPDSDNVPLEYFESLEAEIIKDEHDDTFEFGEALEDTSKIGTNKKMKESNANENLDFQPNQCISEEWQVSSKSEINEEEVMVKSKNKKKKKYNGTENPEATTSMKSDNLPKSKQTDHAVNDSTVNKLKDNLVVKEHPIIEKNSTGEKKKAVEVLESEACVKNVTNEDQLVTNKNKKKRKGKNSSIEDSQILFSNEVKDPSIEENVTEGTKEGGKITPPKETVEIETNEGTDKKKGKGIGKSMAESQFVPKAENMDLVTGENITVRKKDEVKAISSKESAEKETNEGQLPFVTSKNKKKKKVKNSRMEESKMVSNVENRNIAVDSSITETETYPDRSVTNAPLETNVRSEGIKLPGATATTVIDGEKVTKVYDIPKEIHAKKSEDCISSYEEEMFEVKSKKNKKKKHSDIDDFQNISLAGKDNLHEGKIQNNFKSSNGAESKPNTQFEKPSKNGNGLTDISDNAPKKEALISEIQNSVDDYIDDFEPEVEEPDIDADPTDWETAGMNSAIITDEADRINKLSSETECNPKQKIDLRVDGKKSPKHEHTEVIDQGDYSLVDKTAVDVMKEGGACRIEDSVTKQVSDERPMERSVFEPSSSGRSSEERESKDGKKGVEQKVEGGKSKKKKKKNRK